jgi:pimeloyl-ACP methyl ester carboxylesterase
MGLAVGRDALGDGFRVLAPSRFGYLRSPMPANASHAAQADAFASLLDALDVPSAAVLAVSAGAQAATQLALRHPERVQALVLITPALYLPPKPGALEVGPPAVLFDYLLASDFLAWTMVHLAPNLLVRVAGVPRSLESQVTPQFRRRLVGWFLPAGARHVGLAHDMRTTTPIAPDLPIEQLRMPVMLISAADDPYLTADVVRYSALRLPRAKVIIYESGGHVLLGQDDRVRKEVQRFVGALTTNADHKPAMATRAPVGPSR